MKRSIGLPIALVIAATSALSLTACEGSSSGGGGTPPTGPSPIIIVTPDSGGTTPSFGVRAGAGTTASILQLEIFATEVVNVQAVDFIFTLPNTLLRLDSFERGELIGAGAQVLVQNGGSNAPTFQILRNGSAVTGTGVILTLNFSAIGAGNGRFDFVDPEAEDPLGLVIPNVNFIGAAVQVVL